jgi:hypothetical protein
VFDCKKPCSRWNLDLGFCLLPRAAKMSWSWKFDIYIYSGVVQKVEKCEKERWIIQCR